MATENDPGPTLLNQTIMKNELGITPGKAEVVGAFVYVLQNNENRTDFRVNVNRRMSADYEAEEVANANLYAEAHNAANETGLTPRQLKEQRDGLLNIIKSVFDYPIEDLIGWSEGHEFVTCSFYPNDFKNILAAINNCENTLK